MQGRSGGGREGEERRRRARGGEREMRRRWVLQAPLPGRLPGGGASCWVPRRGARRECVQHVEFLGRREPRKPLGSPALSPGLILATPPRCSEPRGDWRRARSRRAGIRRDFKGPVATPSLFVSRMRRPRFRAVSRLVQDGRSRSPKSSPGAQGCREPVPRGQDAAGCCPE